MPYSGLEETESDHLIVSRREKCRQLLAQEELSEEDLIELYIALHTVLEVGLNALLRRLTLWHAETAFNRIEVINRIDDINFRDKMAMFLYHAHFDFGDQIEQAEGHHSILKKMANFSEIRNQLLHGHSISTFFFEGEEKESSARRKMNQETLAKQINLFREIVEGAVFYLDHLVVPEGEKIDKQSLKEKYLDLGFLAGAELA